METLPIQTNTFVRPYFSILAYPIRPPFMPMLSVLDFFVTFSFQGNTASLIFVPGVDWIDSLYPLSSSALGVLGIVDLEFRNEVARALASRLHALATGYLLSFQTGEVDIAVNIELAVDETWYYYPPQEETIIEGNYGVQDSYDIDDNVYNNEYEVFNEELEETETMSSFEVVLQKLERVTSIDERASMVGEDCPVCLNELVTLLGTDDNDSMDRDNDGGVVRLPCKHVFHESCITSWFKKSTQCPMCRFCCVCC